VDCPCENESHRKREAVADSSVGPHGERMRDRCACQGSPVGSRGNPRLALTHPYGGRVLLSRRVARGLHSSNLHRPTLIARSFQGRQACSTPLGKGSEARRARRVDGCQELSLLTLAEQHERIRRGCALASAPYQVLLARSCREQTYRSAGLPGIAPAHRERTAPGLPDIGPIELVHGRQRCDPQRRLTQHLLHEFLGLVGLGSEVARPAGSRTTC
jgi:hypothetical protein